MELANVTKVTAARMYIFNEYFDIFCTKYMIWIEKWKKSTPALNRVHNLVKDTVTESEVSLCITLQQPE